MDVVFQYVAENNPQGCSLPGVPLRDLMAADIAALPVWLRSSIAAQPFYVAVEAAAKPKRQPAQEQGNG